MRRAFRACILSLLMLLTFLSLVHRVDARAESTDHTIAYLIDTVAKSQLTFIRNGESHTCKEAADHIRKKYEFYQSKIHSPEDFISMCASKSLLSGKPYMVSTSEGTIPVEQWLKEVLARHQKDQESSNSQ